VRLQPANACQATVYWFESNSISEVRVVFLYVVGSDLVKEIFLSERNFLARRNWQTDESVKFGRAKTYYHHDLKPYYYNAIGENRSELLPIC
jgi:hypothetical protein